MSQETFSPVVALDIREGVAHPVTTPWPEAIGAAGYRWIHLDLTAPVSQDWLQAHLPQIVWRSLTEAETRPRCEQIDPGLLVNLRVANLDPTTVVEDMVSIRIWVADGCIITTRRRRTKAMEEFRQMVESGSAPTSTGDFLNKLAFGITRQIETVALDLQDTTDTMEESILSGDTPASTELAALRLTVIKLRRYANPQREALEELAALAETDFGPDVALHLNETANRTRRVVEELDAIRDRLAALQDQIEAEHTKILGRNSFILSVVAAIFLPLGFVTGLFGVNIAGMPGTDTPFAFWILTGACAISACLLALIFRFARWW